MGSSYAPPLQIGKFYEIVGDVKVSHGFFKPYKIKQADSEKTWNIFTLGSPNASMTLVLSLDTDYLIKGSTAPIKIENTQSIHFKKLIDACYMVVTMDGNQPKITWRKK